MNINKVVHNLLYLALKEIYGEAQAAEDKVIADLADLFQPLPFQLEHVTRGVIAPDEPMLRLREHATQKKMASWLNAMITQSRRWHGEEDTALAYRLLYEVLVEIRFRAHQSNQGKIFSIADIFHNIPLLLQKVWEGRTLSAEIIDEIRNRAHDAEYDRWFNENLTQAKALR